MKSKIKILLTFLKDNGGMLRFSEILEAGFHPDSIVSLMKEGSVEKISRGLYRLTKYPITSYPDLISASAQSPQGVICLISALSFYEATNEVPKCVDIAVPRGSRTNRIKYPPVRFYRFAPESWKAGVEARDIEGRKVKIYNLAKTIADCFKFRNKIGMNVARDALKIAVSEKGIKPQDIMMYAKVCRVDKIIKPILETIL